MENESVEKVKRIANEYLNYRTIGFDRDFNQIFLVNHKGQRYPLAYVDLRRVIMILNEGDITNQEAAEVKRKIAEYIIQAIEEKKSREEKNKNKNAKSKNEKTGQ